MEQSVLEDSQKLFGRAMSALAANETPAALALLERALKQEDNPSWYSYLGYCIAKERGQVKKGKELCLDCLEREPENPAHHLNLARVHLVANEKNDALATLRKGMSAGGSPEILDMLTQLGMRKPPVLSFLARDNFLNKSLGLLLSRLGLR